MKNKFLCVETVSNPLFKSYTVSDNPNFKNSSEIFNGTSQLYSSKDTSINTVSAIYKHINIGIPILDYGGGKYDTNYKYMLEKCNANVIVYDPYNRTKEHNERVLCYFKDYPSALSVCSNVLNVIKEDEIILDILQHIRSLMCSNGILLIKVYERDKSSIGCKTTKGWQRNQRLEDYLPFIKVVFGKDGLICIKDNILTVKKI